MSNLQPECQNLLGLLEVEELIANAKQNIKDAVQKLNPVGTDPLGMALAGILDNLDRARRLLGDRMAGEEHQ